MNYIFTHRDKMDYKKRCLSLSVWVILVWSVNLPHATAFILADRMYDNKEIVSGICLNGGIYPNISGSCICSNGWKGSRCDIDIDECLLMTHDCMNDATCNNTLGAYTCECKAGWKGPRCDVDINECLLTTHGCMNDAICNNTLGSYTCECKAGWKGPRCNIDINECLLKTHDCMNGAICNNTLGSYTCECKAGWTGRFCEID